MGNYIKSIRFQRKLSHQLGILEYFGGILGNERHLQHTNIILIQLHPSNTPIFTILINSPPLQHIAAYG